ERSPRSKANPRIRTMNVPTLTPVEARVLAVLIEKQRSVPDTYPMSVNALVSGCNQKTSRAPLMNVSDNDVLQALDALKVSSLIVETSGGGGCGCRTNTS